MQTHDFFNSAFALRLGLWLGRTLSPRTGYVIADALTGVLARRTESALYRTITSNLRVVLGPDASEERVARTVRQVLHHTGRVYFDMYHGWAQGLEAMAAAVRFSPQTDYYIQELGEGKRGAMVISGHLSNWEMAALAFAIRRIPLQFLTWADPTSGYELQNRLRSVVELEWTPIDSQALRRALRRLRSGGFVATAADRPDPFGGGEMIPFFGQPARMPVGHIRLALQTDVPILVAVCEYRPVDHCYVTHVVQRLEVERVGDRHDTVIHNARRVLKALEGCIRAHPDQWLMFYPVWEEDLLDAP